METKLSQSHQYNASLKQLQDAVKYALKQKPFTRAIISWSNNNCRIVVTVRERSFMSLLGVAGGFPWTATIEILIEENGVVTIQAFPMAGKITGSDRYNKYVKQLFESIAEFLAVPYKSSESHS